MPFLTLPPPPPLPISPLPIQRQAQSSETERPKRKLFQPGTRTESDFLPGDIEVKIRLGFNGDQWDPLSLFTSFLEWYEFGLSVETGVFQWRQLTFAFGGELYYSRPYFQEVLNQRASDLPDVEFLWNMHDRGLIFRSTAHYVGLASIDPYLMASGGVAAYSLKASTVASPETIARYDSPSLRLAVGGGISALMLKNNLVFGVELRYILAFVFKRPAYLYLPNPDPDATAGGDVGFDVRPIHQPAHGFSWVLQAGYRF